MPFFAESCIDLQNLSRWHLTRADAWACARTPTRVLPGFLQCPFHSSLPNPASSDPMQCPQTAHPPQTSNFSPRKSARFSLLSHTDCPNPVLVRPNNRDWSLPCILFRSTGAGYSTFASEGAPLIHEGDTVRFQVADIFLPAADDLSKALTSADQLEGTVVNFSDSGLLPRVFAVVDVIARRSFVVPVEKLQKLGETPNAL